jgi:hypothetical protein
MPSELKVRFDEFCPPLKGLQGESFALNWEQLADEIERARRRLARTRYIRLIKKHVAEKSGDKKKSD